MRPSREDAERPHPAATRAAGLLALRTTDPLLRVLLEMWRGVTLQVCGALAAGNWSGLPRPAARQHARIAGADTTRAVTSDRTARHWLVLNDQFGLSQLVSGADVRAELAALNRLALPSRFNRRGRGDPPLLGPAVVLHDSAHKEAQLSRASRRAGRRAAGPAGHAWSRAHRQRVERSERGTKVERRAEVL